MDLRVKAGDSPRIIEYLKLVETQKDHRVQPPAPVTVLPKTKPYDQEHCPDVP